MTAPKIDVLIVDDSIFIRNFLTKILRSDPEIGEIRTANDGLSALAVLNSYHPHIITLDIEMPRLNGIETLKAIKQKFEIGVIMVSSITKKGADITIKALELGALDWIQKPENTFDSKKFEELAHELIQKVKILARKKRDAALISELSTKTSIKSESAVIKPEEIQPDLKQKDNITNDMFLRMVHESKWQPAGTANLDFYLIAIGISTGGPSALNQVIPKFKKDMNAAIIIVQHMPSTFTKVLADRIDGISDIKVKEAEDNETIRKGVAYIIPGDKHVRLIDKDPNNIKIKLDVYPKIGGFRPSAESLFYFTAETAKQKSIGVVMTGMGSDGSDNIGLIQKYSKHTIAQDEASCVIFGMPKVAIRKGHIDFVLPLSNIVDKINEFIIR